MYTMLARALMTLLVSTAALGVAAPTTNRLPAVNPTAFAIDGAAIAHSTVIAAAPAEDAVGSGWRPLSIQGCALALGTLIGALVTTGPFAPIVASVAGHAALFACF
jgi:hypothetical protein